MKLKLACSCFTECVLRKFSYTQLAVVVPIFLLLKCCSPLCSLLVTFLLLLLFWQINPYIPVSVLFYMRVSLALFSLPFMMLVQIFMLVFSKFRNFKTMPTHHPTPSLHPPLSAIAKYNSWTTSCGCKVVMYPCTPFHDIYTITNNKYILYIYAERTCRLKAKCMLHKKQYQQQNRNPSNNEQIINNYMTADHHVSIVIVV